LAHFGHSISFVFNVCEYKYKCQGELQNLLRVKKPILQIKLNQTNLIPHLKPNLNAASSDKFGKTETRLDSKLHANLQT